MKLFGSSEKRITKDKNHDKVPRIEVTEVVLVYCKIVNNSYQYDSRVFYTFTPNKSIDSLFDISLTTFIFLKKFKCDFSHAHVWFTNQNFVPLKPEDWINLTLVDVYI